MVRSSPTGSSDDAWWSFPRACGEHASVVHPTQRPTPGKAVAAPHEANESGACLDLARAVEGHGFYSYKDRVDFYHRVEAFLARNLGGATLTPAN